MPHVVALALRRQVCGIRTSLTSMLPAAVVGMLGMLLSALPASLHAATVQGAQGAQGVQVAQPAGVQAPAPAQRAADPQGASPATGAPAAGADARVVAVLLPLESPTFGRAAAHVRSGLTAAWSHSANKHRIDLRFIPVGDQAGDIVASYNQALAANAQAIIGPLIRDQVSLLATALAKSDPVNVPTLALNVVDGDPRLAQNLFLFGLSTEADARQVARLALRDGHKRALVLTQPNAFSRRVQQAFIEAFSDAGGSIAAQHAAVTDLGALNRLRAATPGSGADMIFIAADLPTARTVRPFTDTQLPAFATSQLWSGPIDPNANMDLNGTRLIDMPWLLEPDHPAVMVYPRSQPALAPENERLYALGIDAYRLAELALERGLLPGLALDGVTGRITLERGHWLTREPVPAQVWQGQLLIGGDRK
jgi:outer membrane PBP1 activator LpoA protein